MRTHMGAVLTVVFVSLVFGFIFLVFIRFVFVAYFVFISFHYTMFCFLCAKQGIDCSEEPLWNELFHVEWNIKSLNHLTSYVLLHRHDSSATRIRDWRPRLSLHRSRADGARHREPHVYWGRPVLRQSLWHQHTVSEGSCTAGAFGCFFSCCWCIFSCSAFLFD